MKSVYLVLSLIFLALFLIFVWPTLYSYNNTIERRNRVTDKIERFYNGEWSEVKPFPKTVRPCWANKHSNYLDESDEDFNKRCK